MKILLVASTIIVPAFMLFLTIKRYRFRLFFNVLAVSSIIIFASISSTSIFQIIIDNTVFMTNIHALFLNSMFLFTGAYLGVFIIYRLMMLTWEER